METQYRNLNKGEQIQEGDEYRYHWSNAWIPVERTVGQFYSGDLSQPWHLFRRQKENDPYIQGWAD